MPASERQVNDLAKLGFQAAELGTETLDLTDPGARVEWDVGIYNEAQITVAGANALVVLKVELSSDGGSRWAEPNPRIRMTGSGTIEGIPVSSANRLAIVVHTADGGGSTEEASAFADQGEPVQRPYQLGQLRPADANAASLYTPDVSGTVRELIVCNTSGADAKARIFHDEDGSTYDEDTALYWDVTVYADRPPLHLTGLEWGVQHGGNVAVRSDTADALNFTAYGTEP